MRPRDNEYVSFNAYNDGFGERSKEFTFHEQSSGGTRQLIRQEIEEEKPELEIIHTQEDEESKSMHLEEVKAEEEKEVYLFLLVHGIGANYKSQKETED